jgi:hypothetical protein
VQAAYHCPDQLGGREEHKSRYESRAGSRYVYVSCFVASTGQMYRSGKLIIYRDEIVPVAIASLIFHTLIVNDGND